MLYEMFPLVLFREVKVAHTQHTFQHWEKFLSELIVRKALIPKTFQKDCVVRFAPNLVCI